MNAPAKPQGSPLTSLHPGAARIALSAAAAAAAALAAPPEASGQYAPPPPPAPFAGFANEALRKEDPSWKAWDLGGLARYRYEVHDGNGIASVPGSIDFRENNTDNHNAYSLELFRAHVGYTDTWWNAYVEGRSSLAQGDERYAYAGTPRHKGKGPESDTIDLHQAYVGLGNPKELPVSLKVGRQELAYGDERIVGAIFWNNVHRVFDAAKIHWQNDWVTADLFSGRPVITEDGTFNVSNDYETFSGLYATTPLIPHHTLDVFGLARNVGVDSPQAEPRPQIPLPAARDIYTVGVRLKSKPGELGPWDYTLDVMGQFGNFLDTRAGAPAHRLEHGACALIANVGYSFTNCPAKPRVALEYAFGSGDDDPTDDSHGTFENLYPTNHKFYGYADFASLQNLHDVRGILQLRPVPRLSVALEAHLFWLAETTDSFYAVSGLPRGGIAPTPGTGYGINPGYSNDLGTELDLIAGYALTRYSSLEAGYCHFFPGEYIESSLSHPAYGARDADFLYLQLLVRF